MHRFGAQNPSALCCAARLVVGSILWCLFVPTALAQLASPAIPSHSGASQENTLPQIIDQWSFPAERQEFSRQPAESGESSTGEWPFESGDGRENGAAENGASDDGEREEFELPSAEQEDAWRLTTKFEDGVTFASENEEFELRIRIMQQTEFKYFSPDDQEPARPGFYIPRFRTYFEGQITRSFEYELSLQRSVEGSFDVLDANINFRPTDAFQVKLGRLLVPYSYDWYDHLEQFFITPERALFPLNFGLSREAGIMVWGELNEGRFEYAVGGFSGQLSGLADTNTTRDAVAYINTRTRGNLHVGGSVALGNQAFPGEALPWRTSIQTSENDEAANAASSVFLEFEDEVFLLGTRRQAAIHAAWYRGPLSLESEFQAGEFRYRTPDGRPLISATGYHVAAGYFLTGEEVTDRSIVVPRCPFDPASGTWGTGAIEAFCRFSRLDVDEDVFTAGLANPEEWTRQLSLIDLGWNWYPNRYVKFYFDWQISLYDTPVLIDPETGETTDDSHLFWLRGQVFF